MPKSDYELLSEAIMNPDNALPKTPSRMSVYYCIMGPKPGDSGAGQAYFSEDELVRFIETALLGGKVVAITSITRRT